MKNKKKSLKLIAAATSFVLTALGSKLSLAYWASAVSGANSNSNGTVTSGSWDRYTTGTAISTCTALRTSVLDVTTSATFHLTQNLNCSTEASPTTTSIFSGTLYGNGFTISNYAIASSRRGLFNQLSGATIQNLVLDNVNVGSAGSRSNSFTGILAGKIIANNTVLKNLRIKNSSAYCSSSLGVGGLAGTTSFTTTVSNVSLENIILDNSNSYAGGIIGRHSGAAITVSDVYVQGTITCTSASGGIVGQIDNASGALLTVNRAVTFANTAFTANNSGAGGVVGNNAKNAAHSITDVFFTGALNSGSNRAGTVYYGTTSVVLTNAWAAQWSSSTISAYTNMVGVSAPYPANYVALRSSLTTSWWSSSLPNITNKALWLYDATSYLYKLNPLV